MNAMNQYVVRGLMATLLFVLYLCLAPSSSSAPAYPDHADPKVGSTVTAAPSSVRIWFDGDLEPVFSTIHVQNQRGENVDKGNGRVNAIRSYASRSKCTFAASRNVSGALECCSARWSPYHGQPIVYCQIKLPAPTKPSYNASKDDRLLGMSYHSVSYI
jgi:hypothetical protein